MNRPTFSSELSILFVAYPLLRVSEESAGGAEQVLLTIEREVTAAGHQTTVAACEGSRVDGHLLSTGAAAHALDAYDAREREQSDFILDYLQENPNEFDLIHDHSGSFFRHAAECPVPVLATLHLPRSFYRQDWLATSSANLGFNCVSQEQAASFSGLENVVGVIQNGIDCARYTLERDKENYLLWLGRICEEKAPHLAIAAAQDAGMPLVIAGQVYPFQYHRDYFEREIKPHLRAGSGVRYVDTPSFAQKLELLGRARALLLTSTAEETSSLVAMEAMACGTTVIAVRTGAFHEVISDGETGFLVNSVDQISAALAGVNQISPDFCRGWVEKNFNARNMALNYELLYRQMLLQAMMRAIA